MARTRNAARVRSGVEKALESARAGSRLGQREVEVGSYARISDAHEAEDERAEGIDTAGVDRQHETSARQCEIVSSGGNQQWNITKKYTDNDISAFKDVVRPAFEAMLLDLSTGVIDGIVVFDLDRLCRRPADLERVIAIYDHASKNGRQLFFRTAHDAIDLASPDGLTLARVMVAFANKASRDTARRVKAAHRATALTGRPVSGTRPFGWNWTDKEVILQDGRKVPAASRILRKKPGADDNKPVVKGSNQVINEVEAHEIRLMAAAVLDGKSLNAIVTDLNRRGIKTSKGNQWQVMTVKQLLLSPRVAGFRVYQGEVLVNEKTSEWVKGEWDPILTVEEWEAVEQTLLGYSLDANGQPVEEPGKRRAEANREYMLSGLLRCGVCKGPLHGNRRNDTHFYYACKLRGGGAEGKAGCGKVSVSGVVTDKLIEQLLIQRMGTAVVDDTRPELWEHQVEYDQVSEQHSLLLDQLRASGSTGKKYEKLVAEGRRLGEEVERLRQDRIAWVQARNAARRQLKVSAESWKDMDVAERRTYVSAELARIYVLQATKRGNKLDPSRIIPEWRETRAP